MTPDARYTPISDYGVIGNLMTSALVSRRGSVDWCSLPHLDSPSVFGAILDADRGGRFLVRPAGTDIGEQRYIEHTNVLETIYDFDAYGIVVTDFMPLRGMLALCEDPDTESAIYRTVSCDRGEAEVDVEWSPRFDYALGETRISWDGHVAIAGSGEETMRLSGLREPPRIDPGIRGDVLSARIRLREGESVTFVSRYGDEEPPERNVGALLAETVHSWREWVHDRRAQRRWAGEWVEHVIRSELVLKLLTYPRTGAIAAAATTSLPEEIGGARNWDYRFTWVRDSALTIQALMSVGHRGEALDFLAWLSGAAAATNEFPHGLRIMYGLRSFHAAAEETLDHLEGYRESRPVRIGNAAVAQRQHDVYCELLAAAFEFVRRGQRLEPELRSMLSRVADEASVSWRDPDEGIWEVRTGPRHFVFSKVMAWVAFDRAVKLHERGAIRGNVRRWAEERDAVHEEVLKKGFDEQQGCFVQSYESRALDAANLLIPVMGFLPGDDPRVQGTIDRTMQQLTVNGLVYRYLSDDGLPGHESTFVICTFWLVDALVLAGRFDEARAIFAGVAKRVNHLGLYSEEIDAKSGAFLGNFPQAFSHVGLINSVLYLSRHDPETAPMGEEDSHTVVNEE
jgi:GH15 family glucan-1,4-alpha-glucosidase